MPKIPNRIVLDTNVCLDLFVFHDVVVVELHALLRSEAWQAVTNPACRDEWVRVLGYPQLALEVSQQAAALQAFDEVVQMVPERPSASDDVRLPRCADPDDQKFLELAWASGAGWLLSKDNEVLQLAKRAARDALFRIATPAEWQAAWLSSTSSGNSPKDR
ncbi:MULTISPECIES: putative toxin-antitoxin system toxin component, PIN family [Dyella]|uniref:Toxin-antitoxin system toxin component, PIN family n=2 Tax=Dyella TaxID=231454 RepID=A0ABY1Z0H4_9GAMM|nr:MULTISPECIES: putative toxin-antitoxin system toxin component, PIN family [Dyella]TBR40512.1 putative toxin-antitoxin system toxin component, PIN family [Dyella terrae]TCI11907.1 putative toxin-antitoxin system toxin component, PIN family [Dyella soli]